MNNAAYHSVVKEKPPTIAWEKTEIQNGLSTNNFESPPLMMKPKPNGFGQLYFIGLVRLHMKLSFLLKKMTTQF